MNGLACSAATPKANLIKWSCAGTTTTRKPLLVNFHISSPPVISVATCWLTSVSLLRETLSVSPGSNHRERTDVAGIEHQSSPRRVSRIYRALKRRAPTVVSRARRPPRERLLQTLTISSRWNFVVFTKETRNCVLASRAPRKTTGDTG